MNYELFFANRRVTVMGLGLLGRGVGDIAFLARCGAEVTVTDMKSEADLEPSINALKGLKNIRYVLGRHDIDDFKNCDLVIKAAGVPLDSAYIMEAQNRGIPVTMSTALCAKLSGIFVIGVTGTRGKSTTTQLIYEALRAIKGKDRVHLGGNVRGVSTLALLPEMKSGDIGVFELDSWQLQGFREEKISPQIAIFTNLLPDHQNYYANSMDAYFADKANIYKYQKPEDCLITTVSVLELIKAHKFDQNGRLLTVSSRDLGDWELKIPGEHNRENAALARAALLQTGLSDTDIKPAFENFKGVAGRLELMIEKNGIRVYNDNNATTPDATIAGIRAVAKDKNVTLIMGGSDKKLDMQQLVAEIRRFCSLLVLLPGSGSDSFRRTLEKEDLPFKDAASLSESLEIAQRGTSPGGVILFSPAFASFGMFNNEYDRNDQFVAAVRDRFGP